MVMTMKLQKRRGADANEVSRTFANYQARYQDLGFSLGMLDVTGYWMTQDTETYTFGMADKTQPGNPISYGHNETGFRSLRHEIKHLK